MKRIITILFIGFALFSNAQQLPHYSLYMLNDALVNPASLSTKTDNQITLMTRDQWSSFDGAPKTQSISYYHLNHAKYKRGINIINDVTGPISVINAILSASYILPVNGDNSFSLGASASLMQYSFDNSKITLEDDGVPDPALSEGGVDKVIGNSFTAAAYYFNSDYFIGLSIPNILGSDLDISNDKKKNKLENHYYLNGGVNFNLKNKIKIVPSLMIKKIGATPLQLDVNTRVIYNNLIWGGLSYRTQDAVIVMLGLDYSDYNIAYSYDITTSSIRLPSAGSHGLLFTYKFKPKKRDRDKDGIFDEEDECPKIPGLLALKGCPDKDGDGIKDSEDECPEEFGLKINKGCPDKDGDGIIDKKDDCPEEPGLPQFKGCPDTDGDGLQDKFDDCDTLFGPISNKGCPEKDTGPLTVRVSDTIFIRDTIYITNLNGEDPLFDLGRVFKNIHFDHNVDTLTSNERKLLDEAVKYLKLKSTIRIQLTGHTDDVGSYIYNMRLSKRRVKAVRKYLVDGGISIKRIKLEWKGESVEKSPGATRAQNRRVEFKDISDK